MILYHATTRDLAAAIQREGFTDRSHEVMRVAREVGCTRRLCCKTSTANSVRTRDKTKPPGPVAPSADEIVRSN
jgi:hypothetical protein